MAEAVRLRMRQVAERVCAAISRDGLNAEVEDRGATVSWRQQHGLIATVSLAAAGNDRLYVTCGVLDEQTELVFKVLTEPDRANLTATDVVRCPQLSKRLETLAPGDRSWIRRPASVDELCRDLLDFALPYIASQSVDGLVAYWREHVESSPPRETPALEYFCYLISRGQQGHAAAMLEQFAAEAPRPATRQLAEDRLQRARNIGLLKADG